MKFKFYLPFVCVVFISLSIHGQTTSPTKADIANQFLFIDLKPFYSEDSFANMNVKLYNAVIKGEATAYHSDSIQIKYTTEEALSKGAQQDYYQINDPTDPKGERLIDTFRTTAFDPKTIESYLINYKLIYDELKKEYQIVFTGLTPLYEVIVGGMALGRQGLFYVSKEDVVKVFGPKEATALFVNCYKALLKTLNYDKTGITDKTTSFYVNATDYLGQYILDGFNKKMYDAAVGLNANSPIVAYQTAELTNFYSKNELLKRGCFDKSVLMMMASNTYPTDTIVKAPFCTEGNKLYSFSFEWKYDAIKMIAYPKLKAFGITLTTMNGDIPEYSTLFWFDWKNANKIFSPVEESLLKYTFYKTLENFKNSHL